MARAAIVTLAAPRGRGRLFGLYLERRGGRWHGGLCQTVRPEQLRAAEDNAARGSSPRSAACA